MSEWEGMLVGKWMSEWVSGLINSVVLYICAEYECQ